MIRVPEQVSSGGTDDCIAVDGFHAQVVAAGVVMHQDRGDWLGLGFAGADVGGALSVRLG